MKHYLLIVLLFCTVPSVACGPQDVNTTLTQPQAKIAHYAGQVVSSLKVAQDFIVQSGAPVAVIGNAQNGFLAASRAGVRLSEALTAYDAATTAADRTAKAQGALAVMAELQKTVDGILGLFNQPGITPDVKSETTRMLTNVLNLVLKVRAELTPPTP